MKKKTTATKTRKPKPPVFKLPKAAKSKWLKALRSGRYKQQRGGLLIDQYAYGDGRSTIGAAYCCLGVANKLKLCKTSGNDFGSSYPSTGFVDKAFIPYKIQDKLVNMNDIKFLSFKEIANWIEEHL